MCGCGGCGSWEGVSLRSEREGKLVGCSLRGVNPPPDLGNQKVGCSTRTRTNLFVISFFPSSPSQQAIDQRREPNLRLDSCDLLSLRTFVDELTIFGIGSKTVAIAGSISDSCQGLPIPVQPQPRSRPNSKPRKKFCRAFPLFGTGAFGGGFKVPHYSSRFQVLKVPSLK